MAEDDRCTAGSYRVKCESCDTNSVRVNLETAVNKVERHHKTNGCTYPDQQTIKPLDSDSEPSGGDR